MEPSVASRHTSVRLAVSGSAAVTKTLRPHTAGEEWPVPGSSVFQAKSASAKAVGKASSLTPDPLGPRKRGQLSAARVTAGTGTREASARIEARIPRETYPPFVHWPRIIMPHPLRVPTRHCPREDRHGNRETHFASSRRSRVASRLRSRGAATKCSPGRQPGEHGRANDQPRRGDGTKRASRATRSVAPTGLVLRCHVYPRLAPLAPWGTFCRRS